MEKHWTSGLRLKMLFYSHTNLPLCFTLIIRFTTWASEHVHYSTFFFYWYWTFSGRMQTLFNPYSLPAKSQKELWHGSLKDCSHFTPDTITSKTSETCFKVVQDLILVYNIFPREPRVGCRTSFIFSSIRAKGY